MPGTELEQPEYIVGTDLFKGTTYGPEKYLPEHKKPYRMMNAVEFSRYMRKIRKDKGFDVDGCTVNMPGRILPVTPGSHMWKGCEIMAQMAISEQVKHKNATLEYVSLVKANSQPVSGSMLYLTLKALDLLTEESSLFRAKVWWRPLKTPDLKLMYFKRVTGPWKREATSRGQKIYALRSISKGKEKAESSSGRCEEDVVHKRHPGNRGFSNFVNMISDQNPHWNYAQARKRGSELWKSLSCDEKAGYYLQSEEKS